MRFECKQTEPVDAIYKSIMNNDSPHFLIKCISVCLLVMINPCEAFTPNNEHFCIRSNNSHMNTSKLLSTPTQRKQKHLSSRIEMKDFRKASSRNPSELIEALPETTKRTIGPKHVAFICDGNSRWAEKEAKTNKISIPFQQQYQNKIRGHQKGASQVVSLLKHLDKQHPDVKYATIYGFSSENWSRPQDEINGIWKVIEETSDSIRSWALRENLQVRILGDLEDDRIPHSLRTSLTKLEADTKSHCENFTIGEPLTLCIAINYGGRNDILNASIKLAQLIADGHITEDEVNHDTFSNLLCTAGVPDPDLVIRTGGDRRISNFLIWNCAYAELYFTDVLWPDFDENELDTAMSWFQSRDRRFGGRIEKK